MRLCENHNSWNKMASWAKQHIYRCKNTHTCKGVGRVVLRPWTSELFIFHFKNRLKTKHRLLLVFYFKLQKQKNNLSFWFGLTDSLSLLSWQHNPVLWNLPQLPVPHHGAAGEKLRELKAAKAAGNALNHQRETNDHLIPAEEANYKFIHYHCLASNKVKHVY